MMEIPFQLFFLIYFSFLLAYKQQWLTKSYTFVIFSKEITPD